MGRKRTSILRGRSATPRPSGIRPWIVAGGIGVALLVVVLVGFFHAFRPDSTSALSVAVEPAPTVPETVPGEKMYLLYNARYGQLHNQVQALVNALTAARTISATGAVEATVVIPLVFSGTEADYEASHRQYKKLSGFSNPAELVGDYFNYSLLASFAPIVPHAHFMATPEAMSLKNMSDVRYMDKQAVEYYRSVYGAPTWEIERPPQRTECNFSIVEGQVYAGSKLMLLPKMFTGISTDCRRFDPFWQEAYARLVPREELRRSAVDFIASLQRPVIGLHLRVIGKPELERITNETLLAAFESQIVSAHPDYGSIYVAFTPGQERVRLAMAHVQEKLPRVVTCADAPNCGNQVADWSREMSQDDFLSTFRGIFSTVLMDSWALVQTDVFFGRSTSTMTRNVQFWRELGLGNTADPKPVVWFNLPAGAKR